MDIQPSQTPPPEMPRVDATLKQESLPTQRIKPLYRGSQIIWYILGVIELLLALRFFLKLLGANPLAGFSVFIYSLTGVIGGPFYLVFKQSQVQGSIFEWSTLLAMFVYLGVAWLIVKALVMSKPITTEEASQKLPEQEKL